MTRDLQQRLRHAWRTLLGADVLSGLSVAIGMSLTALLGYAAFGTTAAINISVGAIIALIPDTPRPVSPKQ